MPPNPTAVAQVGDEDLVEASPAVPADEGPPAEWWGTLATRTANWAFVALLVAAGATIRWLARDQWFQTDEWGFLADRQLSSVDDLFQSWNQHWVTVPVVAYRLLWRVVGLHHYWPYQFLAIGSHLAIACLLRVLMRRSGVHPWVATASATLFLFYGSGRDDLVNGFQVAFNGALALGLAHLLLADHDGGLDRRDAVGIGCGMAGLMFSGIAIPMVAVVGIATLARRGWRIALVHTLPLAAVFALWWTQFRGPAADKLPGATLWQYLDYAWDLATSPITRLGQVRGVGVALAITAVIGLALAVRGAGWATVRRRYAAVGASVIGAFGLGLFVARGRAGIPFGPAATSERYTHLAAALILPALALGVSEIARRWRPFLVVAVGIFLVGIPGNIDRISLDESQYFTFGGPELVLSVAERAETSRAPDDRHPLTIDAPLITVGWLRAGRASGRIPDPPATTSPAVRARARLALAVTPVDDVDDLTCTAAVAGAITVDHGDRLRITESAVRVTEVSGAGPPPGLTFYASGGQVLLGVEDGPLVVQVDPPGHVEVCR